MLGGLGSPPPASARAGLGKKDDAGAAKEVWQGGRWRRQNTAEVDGGAVATATTADDEREKLLAGQVSAQCREV